MKKDSFVGGRDGDGFSSSYLLQRSITSVCTSRPRVHKYHSVSFTASLPFRFNSQKCFWVLFFFCSTKSHRGQVPHDTMPQMM